MDFFGKKKEEFSLKSILHSPDNLIIDPFIAEQLRNAFMQVEKKNGKIFFALSPLPFSLDKKIIEDLTKIVGENRMLSDGEKTFSVEACYDTIYHPNYIGREIATAKLIKQMCKYFECNGEDRADKIINKYDVLMPLVADQESFGAISGPYPQSDLPIVRWAHGPKATFFTYAPPECNTRIVVEGRPAAETKKLRININGSYKQTVEYQHIDFTTFSFNVPGNDKANEISFEFDNWYEGTGLNLALLIRRMEKIVECK